MTIKEFIEENKEKYAVIDIDKNDIHYDTANGFTSDEEDMSIFDEAVENATITEMAAIEYVEDYLKCGDLDTYGYDENDMFCVIAL